MNIDDKSLLHDILNSPEETDIYTYFQNELKKEGGSVFEGVTVLDENKEQIKMALEAKSKEIASYAISFSQAEARKLLVALTKLAAKKCFEKIPKMFLTKPATFVNRIYVSKDENANDDTLQLLGYTGRVSIFPSTSVYDSIKTKIFISVTRLVCCKDFVDLDREARRRLKNVKG